MENCFLTDFLGYREIFIDIKQRAHFQNLHKNNLLEGLD